MLKRLKLRSRILLAYAVPIFLTFIVAWLAHYAGERSIEATQTIDLDNDLLDLNHAALRALLNNETGFRGFLITGQDKFLEPLRAGRDTFDIVLSQIQPLVKDQPDVLAKWLELDHLVKSRLIPWQDSLIADRRRGGDDVEERMAAAIETGFEKSTMDDARARIEELRKYREVEYQEAHRRGQEALDQVSEIVFIGAGIGAVIAILAGLAIANGIVRTVNETVSAISTSSSQIASTINEHERNATQQAAAVNETTATMDELGTSSRQSAEQAESISTIARESLPVAELGAKTVQQTIDAMTALKDRVESVAEQILRLSEHTSQIGNITNLVSDLANQTNLLAINAAVEAARAGDHGKGFAVVAVEIRKLADQSKKSAERINNLVLDIQRSTNSTVMATEEGTKTLEEGMRLVDNTGEAFNSTATAFNTMFENVQQISLNMKQQAAAIRQVVEAMSSLNTGAKETAVGISQTKAGIQTLVEAARRLKEMV